MRRREGSVEEGTHRKNRGRGDQVIAWLLIRERTKRSGGRRETGKDTEREIVEESDQGAVDRNEGVFRTKSYFSGQGTRFSDPGTG